MGFVAELDVGIVCFCSCWGLFGFSLLCWVRLLELRILLLCCDFGVYRWVDLGFVNLGSFAVLVLVLISYFLVKDFRLGCWFVLFCFRVLILLWIWWLWWFW